MLGGPGLIDIMGLLRSIQIDHAVFSDRVSTPALLRQRTEQLFSWIRDGKRSVKIGGAYPLAETVKAYSDMESRLTTGNLLFVP